MLLRYLITISPADPVVPMRIASSKNAVLPPESPGTSALMARRDDSSETPKVDIEGRSKGCFFCFNQCYWWPHNGAPRDHIVVIWINPSQNVATKI